MPIKSHLAFILHSRPYRETSQLIDVFCEDIGKVSLIYRGGRRCTRMKKGSPQPFTLLQIEYFGRGSLKTVKSIEAVTQVVPFRGNRVFVAMYVNELLYRLLLAETTCDGLFQTYQNTLLAIAGDDDLHATLRNFELTLLETLGYGVNFDKDIYTGKPLEVGFDYQYQQQLGFFVKQAQHQRHQVYSGAEIQALVSRSFTTPALRCAAKRFCRQALGDLLGNKQLHSRSLFTAVK
ncbi:MAG: DNA repair protein RecO [Psychromonas sp.]|nr:DNA repair protein RecO [Psychromonas sp.]